MAPSSATDLARRALRRLRPHVPALVVLAIAALLYVHRIDTWLIEDDEEGYLYAAWRISRGELPYRDFLTPQLPAFLYPGAGLVALVGRWTGALRTWSAILVLGAATATYLTSRRLFGAVAGLSAMVVLLATDDVFAVGRAFRPEATMLLLASAALCAFVYADTRKSRTGYAVAGVLFGLGGLAKLFAVLPWAAAAAYLVFDSATGDRSKRRTVGDLATLLAPGSAIVISVMGAHQLLADETYAAVVGHHLAQGSELPPSQVLSKTVEFYWRALNWHAPLLAFVPAGLLAIRRLAPRRGWVIAWQLPTVLAFFLLTRQLWARHLVYLLPAMSILFGAAMSWLWQMLADKRSAAVLVATMVAAISVPHLLSDLGDYSRQEIGTERLASLVRTLAPPGTRIISDYPGVGFYAGRATTYSAAGLSEGATESGQITGRMLLDEMAAGDVTLALIDTFSQGGHIVDVVDYEEFEARLLTEYERLGRFWRQYQPHDVYLRRDLARSLVDYGWAELVALGAERRQVQSGGELLVDVVLTVKEPTDERYTAFLHLVGADGATWGQGDDLLTNALYRATEEWERGEIVAQPLRLQILPGTPPGSYRLEFGLYDRETGTRLDGVTPDGPRASVHDAGQVEVVRPDSPAPFVVDREAGAFVGGSTGGCELVGVELPSSVIAGWPLAMRLTWRVSSLPSPNQRLRVEVRDAGGRRLAQTEIDPGSLGWPTAQWRRREIIATRVVAPLDPQAAAGEARVTAVWLDKSGAPLGEELLIGRTLVEALAPAAGQPPTIENLIEATLDGRIELLGSSLGPHHSAGEPLLIDLYWRALSPIDTTYSVLLHVLDQSGSVVAQADGPPVGGTRPTTSWRVGEVISDQRVVSGVAGLPSGTYRVLAGLYDSATPGLTRLRATLDGAEVPDGRVPIGSFEIRPAASPSD